MTRRRQSCTLITAELQNPAFPCVNPADEVIPEEVNLSIRPLLYTSVCTSNLGRPRREIGGSLFPPPHDARGGGVEKTWML